MLPPALVELALRPWGRAAPGLVQHATPERLVEFVPSFPIPGPNHVCLIRCTPERVDAMIDETRRVIGAHGLACQWLLDPDVQPVDLAERLATRDIVPREEMDVMVLPASAPLEPGPAPVEIVDGLRDEVTYDAVEEVQRAAFGARPVPGRSQRFENSRRDAARHCFLALLEGEPAGTGWATVREHGVGLNGGAVHPRFQGRGVYRALLAARLALAQRAGVEGVTVQARQDTSAPILSRLGFTLVGRWRAHADLSPTG
jgi:GNAT superfamily N-acetyltransferase